MLEVIVMTAQQCLFEGRASQVIFPGEGGVFEVLRFHRPIISCLVGGSIVIDETVIPIARGVAKVERNRVTAIVDPDAEDAAGG
jgi:F0F1-type ATP synthase epsilon subunit